MSERSSLESALERLLTEWVQSGRVPGAAASIRRGATSVRAVVGFAATRPQHIELSESTRFDLASLTKILATAPLLTQAARRGELGECGVDSSLRQLWPELVGSSNYYGDTTLVELASHRSGLPAWTPLSLLGVEPNLASVAERLVRIEPESPGQVTYSDLGFLLLGAMLERRSALPFAELFRQRVADPAGVAVSFGGGASERVAATELSNSCERSLAEKLGLVLPERNIEPGQVHDGNAAFLGGVAPHAGLFGSLREVEQLLDAISAGELPDLDAEEIARMHQECHGSGRSLGWELAHHNSATRGILPDTFVGHLGFTGTSAWLNPSGNERFVLLTNRVHPEVGDADFQELRREFHRLAIR